MVELQQAIDNSLRGLCSHGQLFYTERQLYYEVCRGVRPWASRLSQFLPAYSRSVTISYEEFSADFKEYVATAGPPRGLLDDGETPTVAFENREPDLADYGIPRVLICENRDLAHMLIENGFHLDYSSAVLSLQEATPLSDMMCALLARAQGARVYFLHDADRASYERLPALPRQLLLPRGLSPEPIGIRPAHAMRMHLFARHSEPSYGKSPLYPATLSPREKAWLDRGWCTEAAAMPPSTLIHLCRDAVLYGRVAS